MKVKKGLRTAILSMAAISGVSAAEECAAAKSALADMKEMLGEEQVLSYTWSPSDGFYA